MMDQNFEIRIQWFLRTFWNSQKGVARSIWTIMVAAKLDQSTVLVTKFHQNWSTLKGRSAGQRQTDSAENKGPSGLQLGQQTQLKTSTSLRYTTPVGNQFLCAFIEVGLCIKNGLFWGALYQFEIWVMKGVL